MPKVTKKPIDYAALDAELDEVLVRLQSADLELDQAVAAYQRGMEIAGHLEAYLRDAKNTVEKVRADWEARAAAS